MSPLTRLLGVRILLDVQFWFPTWMIYLLDQGYSPLEAAAVDAAFNAVMVLTEVPMGWVADRIGRKRALLATCLLTVVVFAGIAVAPGFWTMLAVWALWGALWALASGVDTTYAWELADQSPGGLSPIRYLGRTRLAGGIAGLISLVTAGALLQIWAPLPYVVTCALGLLALGLAVGIPDVVRATRRSVPQPTRTWRDTLGRSDVRTGVILAALVLTAGISIRIVFQPVGLALGLDPFTISLSYGLIAVTVAIGGWTASRIPARRRGLWTILAVAAMAASYLATAATVALCESWLTMLVAIPAGTAAFGLGKTLTDIWLVESVGPRRRATVLSLASAANGLIMVGIRPLMVVTSEGAGNTVVFVAWGCLSAVICGVCMIVLRHPRTRRARRQPTTIPPA